MVANDDIQMARDRTEDGRDAKRGAVIKDKNGRLIAESKEVFEDMGGKLQGAAERKRSSKLPRAPSSVGRQVDVEEIGKEEVKTSMYKMKKARRQGQMKCG